MIVGMWMATTAMAKTTAIVCSPFEIDPSGCDFDDLGEAVSFEEYVHFVLEVGVHPAHAVISRAVTIEAKPGAVLTARTPGQAVLDVFDGSGSLFTDLVFDGANGAAFGPMVFVSSSTVEFVNLQVRDMASSFTPILWFDALSDVTLTAPEFENLDIYGGYSILVNGGALTIRSGTFSDGGGSNALGVLYAADSDVTVEDTTFSAAQNSASIVTVLGTTLQISDTKFYPGSGAGVAVAVFDSTLTLDGGEFAASDLSTTISATLSDIELVDTEINLGSRSMGMDCFGCWSVHLDGVTIDGPIVWTPFAGVGPLVSITDTPEVTIEDTWFCGAAEAGALSLVNSCVFGACELRESVFYSNRGDLVSGGVTVSGSTLDVDRSTFVGNYTLGPLVGGTLHANSGASVAVRRSLFTSGFGGPAMVAVPGYGVDAFEENAFAYAYPKETTFALDGTNATDVYFSFIYSKTTDRCGVNIDIDVEASDPFLVEHDVGAGRFCWDDEVALDGVDRDCDGTELCPADDDNDGFGGTRLVPVPLGEGKFSCLPLGTDCDDSDSTRYPGAVEVWYDGVDSDCDGGDDFDADADGFPIDLDCNDRDVTVYPGAADDWYDGVDSDCAGDDDDDADTDGVPVSSDCNDGDPTVGVCRLSGSGCEVLPMSAVSSGTAVGLVFFALGTLRRRVSGIDTRA